MRYGEVLQFYLNKTGISKAELARRVGISRSQVSEWINGDTKEPVLTRAHDVAEALGVPLQEMLDMMFSDKD